MHNSAPLKLIFVTIADKDGKNARIHAGFYDLFGGIPEVMQPDTGGPPELVVSPINSYIAYPHEIVTLWIKPEEKEKVGQAIRDLFSKHDPLTIFSGSLVSTDNATVTDTGFCVEALRAALPILPDVPVNFITPQKLYTVLKMMGGM